MNDGRRMRVSVIIIALNEEKSLPALLSDLRRQSYDHSRMEILLVDSQSADGTKALMTAFSETADFSRVLCLDNPGRILACGWNVALRRVDAGLVIRLDAHARIPPDFVEKNVVCIAAGHDICGGKVKNHILNKTPWRAAVNAAEDSMFGGSVAAFRRQDRPGVVSTLAFAAYRKAVFDAVGPFDERLVRTEDNEMHYRMRKAGYAFYYTPEIESSRETRSDFRALLRQKVLNGYWIGRTLWIEPRCFSLYHFVPLAFVLAIAGTGCLALGGLRWPAAALWVSYGAVNILMSLSAMLHDPDRNPCYLALPPMFLLLHTGYGLGTLSGLVDFRDR